MEQTINERDLNLLIRISREKRFKDIYEGKESINKIEIEN
jgi:hypothetical protein